MLKFKLAALAAVIGISGAFATVQRSSFAAHKWSFDAPHGVYTDITGEQKGTDYLCNTGTVVCTATYPQGQDPNVDNSNPLSTELGIFN